MKLSLTLAVAAGLLFSGMAVPGFAQSTASGSCETLAATNPGAIAQLCSGPREFPEWTDPVMGDGDGVPECASYLPADARWGDRVLVAC